VSTLTIYYPGLLGPDVQLHNLDSKDWPDISQVSGLCEVLSHGTVTAVTKQEVEARILECLGVEFNPEQGLPVSHFRASQYEMEAENIWCIDPVHVAVDRDEAVLLANMSLNIDEHEARSLIDDLNRHFESDGLQIHYHKPHQWLLTGNIDLQTCSLSRTMFRDINCFEPTGKDEKKWRVLINEVQMLLHAHPVNELRGSKGVETINSLWLWGKGKPEAISTTSKTVLADNLLVEDVARTTGVACHSLSVQFAGHLAQSQDMVMIFTNQLPVIWRKDVFGWFEHLKHFDRDYLEPSLNLLRQEKIDQLVVLSDTLQIKLDQKNLKQHFWQIWKKKTSLEPLIKKLRSHYGY
jgi:hypothetical protein